MMDLVTLTQQRLDYLQAYIDLVPEEFKSKDFEYDYTRGYDCLVSLDMPLANVPEWAGAWINLARWNCGVLPGVQQLQTPEQKTQFNKLRKTVLSILSYILNDTNFPAITTILDRIPRAMGRNQWITDFLREDQIVVVNQARQYLAYNAASYTQTFYQTKEEFSRIYPNLKSFLNTPVLMQDLNNVNLVEAPTGTGKTRISIVANMNRFSWTNDLAVNTVASDQLLVFVRTRSQTQSFIKESNRLGLTVACPISQGLGCDAHNTTNRLLLANLENIIYRTSNKHSYAEIWVPRAVPIELYDYNLNQESTETSSFGRMLRKVIEIGLNHTDLKPFLAEVKKAGIGNALMECFRNKDLKKDMQEYLSSTTQKCASCKAGQLSIEKDVKKHDLQDLPYFPQLKSDFFDFSKAGKNVDINFLAHFYQNERGWCGRKESQENLDKKDVLILTYNWLTDVDLSAQLIKRFEKVYLDDDNPDHDFQILEKAVICDEAHTLYNYNYTFSFGFSNLIQTVVDLQRLKLLLSYPSFKLKGMDMMVANPYFSKHFKPLRLEVPVNGKEKFIVDDVEGYYAGIWHTLHSINEGIYQVLNQLNFTKNDRPMIANLYQALIGGGYGLPWKIYSCFDDPVSTFKMDYEMGDHAAKVMACYTQMNEVYTQLDYLTTTLELDKKTREADIQTLLKEESVAGGPWVRDYRKAWQTFPDRDKVTIRKYVNHLEHLYVDPIRDLAKIAAETRDFLLLSLEVLYSGSGDKTRILAVGSEDDDKNGLDYRPFDKFRLVGLESPMEMNPAFIEATFKSYKFYDLYNTKGNIYIDSCRFRGYYKKVSCSLKVNRPAIQWALRPYSYVTFLTGTAPAPTIWKSKSGFNQFNVSTYPVQKNPFEYEFVADVTLTYANRSRDNYKKLATNIFKRTQAKQTLVCYPSGKVLEDIRKIYEEDCTEFPGYLDANLFETKGAKLSLDDIQKYVEGQKDGAVHVVMGGKYVEGIEFTDDTGSSLIKQVIIVGVPFNPPSEELTQVEEYYQKVFGWNPWDCRAAFWYGPVKEKVLQARGRSVRNLTDRAKIVFMDSRYVTDNTLRTALNLL
jgi:hypothetical protein